MSQKRILILPSWYPPKGGYFFVELSEATQNEYYSIEIFTNTIWSLKEFPKTKFSKPNQENNLKVYRHNFYRVPKFNVLNEKRWIKESLKKLEKQFKQFGKPDLIHAHSVLWGGILAYELYLRFQIPYIITEHRGRFIGNTSEAIKLLPKRYTQQIHLAFKATKKIITVSPALNKTILEYTPSAKNKIISIPNTVDINDFHPKEVKPNKKFTFLSIGNLWPVKGMDILLKAFAKINSKNCQLMIGGDGYLREELENLSENLNISSKVKFLGRLSREAVIENMQHANAFVLASRFEAFGVVFIEAMATGLPIIGTKSGGPNFIINEKNGFIVEVESVEALTLALEKIIVTNFDKKEIRKIALNNYNKEIIGEKYRSIYQNILNA